jgi:O-antigen/teichoic acid export membrane protein
LVVDHNNWGRLVESTLVAEAPQEAPRGILARLRGHLDLFLNAGSLMATTAITSLFGFAFWWLAARTASLEAVGQASAAVSAMTLIGTIGMFGMGTMLIAELPGLRGHKWELISTCLLIAGGVATLGGIVYVALAHSLMPGLSNALGSTPATILLVVGIGLNAITLVLDEALVGLLQGPMQLMRNAWFSLIKLVLLGLLALLPIDPTGGEVLLTWVAGMVLSVVVLGRALHKRDMIDSLRPRASLLRGRGRKAFDHNLLNLATYLPRAALPLVVTAVLSAEANAAFYTAFMILSFLAMVPGNVAITLFAVASGDKAALQSKVRVGLAICLIIGLPASLVVALAADPIMSLFGESYAEAAGTTLMILALTYLPFVFHHFFLAISRVQGRVRQAGYFSLVAGAAELIAAWYGGSQGSLTSLVTWVAIVLAVETVLVAPIVLRVVFARTAPEGENIVSTTGMTLREKAWLPLEYVRTVGPLDGVTADRMRAALIGLHAADPTHRAVSALDRQGARWVHLNTEGFAEFVRGAVTDLGDAPADFDAMTLRLQAEPRGEHPVRLLVGGGYVAMKVVHAYGDAGPVNVLLRELVKAAGEGRAASIRPSARHRWALPRAWFKQFGTKPDRWREGIGFPKPPEHDTAETRPWAPALTMESVRSASALQAMREWRDENAPGVTTSAITFAAVTAALREVGLDPDDRGAIFLADARRYLGKDVQIDSNFCMGPYLSPEDLTDPTSIHTTLKGELATGRLLTMLVLREGNILVTGSRGEPDPYPSAISAAPRPRMTYSNQGRHDMLGDLPWSVDVASRINQSVPTACDPEGIMLATSEMNGVLHLEVSFHSTTYDRVLLAEAIRRVCADPARLIKDAARIAARR